MEIIFDKTKKIIALSLIFLMVMSFKLPTFAASTSQSIRIRTQKEKKVLKEGEQISLTKGNSLQLEYSVVEKYAGKKLEWISSNTKIAKVSNGKVTGVAAGTATITLRLKSNTAIKTTMKVKVNNPPAANTSKQSKTFKFTYYTVESNGGNEVGAYPLTTKNFKIDSTLGCYTYNGKIVLAAATNTLANYWKKEKGYTKKSHIKYFDYYKEVEFTYNGKKYKGIIIDSCGASMNVKKGDPNIIDVFFPTKAAAEKSKINQKKIMVYY